MLDIIFSIFWGIILVLSILSIPYIIIRYEINRHQDKKKKRREFTLGESIALRYGFASLIHSFLFCYIWPIVIVEIWVSGLISPELL